MIYHHHRKKNNIVWITLKSSSNFRNSLWELDYRKQLPTSLKLFTLFSISLNKLITSINFTITSEIAIRRVFKFRGVYNYDVLVTEVCLEKKNWRHKSIRNSWILQWFETSSGIESEKNKLNKARLKNKSSWNIAFWMPSALKITYSLKISEVSNRANKAHPCLKNEKNKQQAHFLTLSKKI